MFARGVPMLLLLLPHLPLPPPSAAAHFSSCNTAEGAEVTKTGDWLAIWGGRSFFGLLHRWDGQTG